MRALIFILILGNSVLYGQDVESIIENYLRACGGRENFDLLITSAKDYYRYNFYGVTDTTHIQSLEKEPAYRFSHVTGMDGALQHETFLNLKKSVIASYLPFPSLYSHDVQVPSDDLARKQWIHVAQEIIYRQKKREFRKVEADTLDGNKVYVIQSKIADPKLKKTFYFDASSGLLVATKIEDLPNNLVHYRDYRIVKNLVFPFTIETSMNNEIIKREVFKSIDINTPIDVQAFDYKEAKIPSKRNPNSRYNKIEWIEGASSINTLPQLTSLLKDQRILIDIWATWCGPCKMEFSKYSDEFYAFLESKKIIMLFISTDKPDRDAQWKEDVNFYNVNGYHMIATKSLIADLLKVNKGEVFLIPRYILISENGQILDNDIGKPSSPTFREKIQSLLPNP